MSSITRKLVLNASNIKGVGNTRNFTRLQNNTPHYLSPSFPQGLRRGIPQCCTLQQKWSVFYQPSNNCSNSSKKSDKPAIVSREMPMIKWKNLAIVGGMGAILYGYLYYMKAKKQSVYQKEKRRVIGKADIGGHFELYDFNGKAVNSDDFKGCWILMYFGFTHCPDICPDELEKIADVVNIFEKEKKNIFVQPLFITVDPTRDSPAALKKYLSEFHSSFVGLTGTKQMIADVCKKYRVYFSEGPKDEDNDYIVDHTIVSYLIDPNGEFVDYFGQDTTAEMIATKIKFSMAHFQDVLGHTISVAKPMPRKDGKKIKTFDEIVP